MKTTGGCAAGASDAAMRKRNADFTLEYSTAGIEDGFNAGRPHTKGRP